jgi:hypothetical protein
MIGRGHHLPLGVFLFGLLLLFRFLLLLLFVLDGQTTYLSGLNDFQFP